MAQRRNRVDRTCQTCGKSFTAKPSTVEKGRGVYCSIPCRRHDGANHPQWKGGRRLLKTGYVTLYSKSASRGRVFEHVFIAEKALGKPLPVGAVVHHVNGVKSDNANSNLVICESNAYHKHLHGRQHILELGGNPNVEWHCGDCGRLLPFISFPPRKSVAGAGISSVCRECCRVRNKERVRRVTK